mgnify:CR=1 FL=1
MELDAATTQHIAGHFALDKRNFINFHLPLFPGCPVTVIQNVAPKLGPAKGIAATIVRVIPNRPGQHIATANDVAAVLLKSDADSDRVYMEGLPPGHLYVRPRKMSITLRHATLPSPDAETPETTIDRLTLSVYQLPITTSFAMTCHKCQGRSLDACVCMQLDPKNVPCMLYVAASRSRTERGFSMLHSVPSSILAYACDSSYLRFNAWVTRLHNATVRRMGAPDEADSLPPPIPTVTPANTPYVLRSLVVTCAVYHNLHVTAHGSIERWSVPVVIQQKSCHLWFWTPLVRHALGVVPVNQDSTPSWATFLKPGDPNYYTKIVAAYRKDFAERGISATNSKAWNAVWEPARQTTDRHTQERVFKPKPFFGLRNDFRSLTCPNARRFVEAVGRCMIAQHTFDELSTLVATLHARIAASVPAAHPDPCANPTVLPLPRPNPDDGADALQSNATVLHETDDCERYSWDGESAGEDDSDCDFYCGPDDCDSDSENWTLADYTEAGCAPEDQLPFELYLFDDCAEWLATVFGEGEGSAVSATLSANVDGPEPLDSAHSYNATSPAADDGGITVGSFMDCSLDSLLGSDSPP